MKIRVFSRVEAEKFEPPPKTYHAWISITTPGDELANLRCRRPWDLGVRRLQFHDIDSTERGIVDSHGNTCTAPDHFDAREIYAFVLWNSHALEHGELYIHCDAGKSRSAGVAAAIAKIYNGTDEEFFKDPYCPNRLIYNLILEIHKTQGNAL